MVEWLFRLKAKLDDKNVITKMVVEPLAKDWQDAWETEDRDEQGRWTDGGGSDVAGSQSDEQGNAVDLHGADDDDQPTDYVPLSGEALERTEAYVGISQPSLDSMSSDQQSALTVYKDGDVDAPGGEQSAADINDNLRNGDPSTTAPALDSVLAASTTTYDQSVFRGLNGSPEDFGLVPGATVTDKGYVSTSVDNRVAQNFAGPGGTVMQIEVPSGSNAYFFKPSDGWNTGNEAEMLLPHDSSFTVDRIDRFGVVHVTLNK